MKNTKRANNWRGNCGAVLGVRFPPLWQVGIDSLPKHAVIRRLTHFQEYETRGAHKGNCKRQRPIGLARKGG